MSDVADVKAKIQKMDAILRNVEAPELGAITGR